METLVFPKNLPLFTTNKIDIELEFHQLSSILGLIALNINTEYSPLSIGKSLNVMNKGYFSEFITMWDHEIHS